MKLVPTTDTGATQTTVTAPASTAPAPAQTSAATKPEPAFTPPQKKPAVPRDEFHGRGGMYVLVNGKRVPADEDGNPLPT